MDIRVGATCHSLQFLQATAYDTGKDVRVGSYVLHYVDGQTAELPLVYGEDLADWLPATGHPMETPNASIAWTGQDIFLWKRTYANPRPEVEITHLDFVSAMAFPAPFVVAITLE